MHHIQPRPHFLQEAPAPAPAGDPGREHEFKVRRAGREGLAPRAEARPEAGHGGAGHPSEGRRLKVGDLFCIAIWICVVSPLGFV